MSIFNNTSPKPGGVDTSKDTVMPDVLLEGYTAHDASGKPITGIHVCRMPKLQEKTVKENGVYTPDDGYTGFSKITVAVASSANDKYLVRTTAANINPPTMQARSNIGKNAIVRSYSVTATVEALE
jgi:hypothetical protein